MLKFWDKYIKILNMSDHYKKKTNLTKNKFYLLSARLKKTYVTNKLYNSVQNTMENFWGELVENWWWCNEFLK